jgi:DNA-directed RNA polymerase specialized sigma24 family protein
MELDAIVTDPAVPAAGDFDRFFLELFPRVARTAALVARDRQLGPDLAQEAFVRVHLMRGRRVLRERLGMQMEEDDR